MIEVLKCIGTGLAFLVFMGAVILTIAAPALAVAFLVGADAGAVVVIVEFVLIMAGFMGAALRSI